MNLIDKIAIWWERENKRYGVLFTVVWIVGLILIVAHIVTWWSVPIILSSLGIASIGWCTIIHNWDNWFGGQL